MTRPNLSGVTITFNALHLDATMDKGWHEHEWTVTALRLAEPWSDGRSMETALESLIDVLAPVEGNTRRLPPELWSNEALARAVCVLGNVVRVDVSHGPFSVEWWA